MTYDILQEADIKKMIYIMRYSKSFLYWLLRIHDSSTYDKDNTASLLAYLQNDA